MNTDQRIEKSDERRHVAPGMAQQIRNHFFTQGKPARTRMSTQCIGFFTIGKRCQLENQSLPQSRCKIAANRKVTRGRVSGCNQQMFLVTGIDQVDEVENTDLAFFGDGVNIVYNEAGRGVGQNAAVIRKVFRCVQRPG